MTTSSKHPLEIFIYSLAASFFCCLMVGIVFGGMTLLIPSYNVVWSTIVRAPLLIVFSPAVVTGALLASLGVSGGLSMVIGLVSVPVFWSAITYVYILYRRRRTQRMPVAGAIGMSTLQVLIRKFLFFGNGILLILTPAAFVVLFVVIFGSTHRNLSMDLDNGGSLLVMPASKLASFWDSDSVSVCKILYQPKNGKPGTVVLWQGSEGMPVIVFPASDGHSLFCLYDWDTVTLLLKIDPSRTFNSTRALPVATGSYNTTDGFDALNWDTTGNYDPPVTDGDIKAVVCSSPWRVEEASVDDWLEARKYLTNLPPDVLERRIIPLGYKPYFTRYQLLQEVEHTVNNVLHGGPPYPGGIPGWLKENPTPASNSCSKNN